MSRRNAIVKMQVWVLAILAGLIVYRLGTGPALPRGLVAFTDLDTDELRHAAIAAGSHAAVVIRATGSFDRQGPGNHMAAYAWITRRADRNVVWSMEGANVEPGRGTLAHVRADTLTLGPGEYDVYFATFGPEVRRERGSWRWDSDRWFFVLRSTEANASLALVSGDGGETQGALWRAAPLEDERRLEQFFTVHASTELSVYAVGQIDRRPQRRAEDYSWIEDAVRGTRLWQLSAENSEPAGGSPSNRRFRGSVTVEPGVYRAVAQTDRRHAHGDWVGNPPHDPQAWGLALSSTDSGAVSTFDPWRSHSAFIDMTGVGDDERLSERFEVHAPTTVVVSALGEITAPDNRYDYAELVEDTPERSRTVWSMGWEASVHAGGASKNRQEVAFLRLAPGAYTLHYSTDGSHSMDEWNAAQPYHAERWGVSLSALAPEGTLTVGASADLPLQEDADETRAEIVSWTRLEGSVEESHAFSLERTRRLHIVSVGEVTQRKQYDYGWIINIDRGETVWEMTYANTVPAGGSEDNRRFDGIVELDPGAYVLYFETDGSHHFGDFDSAPEHAEEWGITLRYADDGL